MFTHRSQHDLQQVAVDSFFIFLQVALSSFYDTMGEDDENIGAETEQAQEVYTRVLE